jgi:hypothetical protein
VPEGVLVKVLQKYGYSQEETEWWKVDLNGKVGFVPRTYVEVVKANKQVTSFIFILIRISGL